MKPEAVAPEDHLEPATISLDRLATDRRLKEQLLLALDKELMDLINNDIIPRWKKNREAVESFLNNEAPYDQEVGLLRTHDAEHDARGDAG